MSVEKDEKEEHAVALGEWARVSDVTEFLGYAMATIESNGYQVGVHRGDRVLVADVLETTSHGTFVRHSDIVGKLPQDES